MSGLFGAPKKRILPPPLIAQRNALLAPNGGPGSVRDPVGPYNPRVTTARSFSPNPAQRASNALADVLQRGGYSAPQARRTAGLVVDSSPVGMVRDVRNAGWQTFRGVRDRDGAETLGGILAGALAGAPGPTKKFGNRIFDKAAALREMIEARGLEVGELSTSTNRFGQHSAYFEVEGGDRLRISDHDANPHFRVAETNWWGDLDPAIIDDFVAKRRQAMIETKARYAEHLAQSQAKSRARRAAFEVQQRKTAANNAMLEAAGLGHLVGQPRKDALKRLRRDGS